MFEKSRISSSFVTSSHMTQGEKFASELCKQTEDASLDAVLRC